jgi:hypothetical protein
MTKKVLCGVAAALLAGATAVAAGLPNATVAGGVAPANKISLHRLNGVTPLSRAQKVKEGYVKMDDMLVRISEAAKTAPKAQLMTSLKSVAPHARLNLTAPRTVPAVLVEIVAKGDAVSTEAQLKQLGAAKTYRFKNHISAWIPVDQLKSAAAFRGVTSMRASQARTHSGSVVTQGDFIQRSLALRESPLVNGVTGAGITIGVMSDSFDCGFQLDSYADNIATGDLPPDVTVLAEEEGCGSGTDEGRAMAQLIYDVAPGSRLKFYSAFNGEAAFAAGILELLDAGAQVIVDDVTYFDEPFFQDGIIGQAADIAAQSGVAYFSSAGNSARDSYEAPFRESGVVGDVGTDIAGERLHNFDSTGATVSTVLPITIPAGSNILTYLQWDQPYASTGGSGAQNSVDICLTVGPNLLTNGPTGPITEDDIIFCTGPSLVNDDPFQIFGGGLGNATDFEGGLVVGVASGAAPGRLKINYQGLSVDQFATNSGTLQGHPNAVGAVAVGASYFRANPICLPDIFPEFTLEDFSSAGGTPVLFDLTGQRLFTPDVRQKPEIVAPDGGRTTFFAQQIGARSSAVPECTNGDADYNFFGTSAAAPHAAGVAALLKEAQPLATTTEVIDAMKATTIDMGVPGVDFDSGYGFIQADAALSQLLPIQTLSAATLGFGDVRLGATSEPQTLTVTNTGAFPLTISSITSTLGFDITSNTCPTDGESTVAAGDSCTVDVTVTPTSLGNFSGSLDIQSNAPSSPISVVLVADGVQSFIGLSASSLSFGSVRNGQTGTAQTVTVTNTGTAPLNVSGVSISGSGFTQSNTCSAAVAVGGTCAITVNFAPNAVRAFSETLTIASDAGTGSPSTVALTGTGTKKGGGAFGLMMLLPGLVAVFFRRRKRA